MAPLLRGSISTIGWGLYCACSWTWCIGMFLPVLLLSRWGWLGFIAFAVPNVIGCAAFAYVLRTRERSQRVITNHLIAMRLFSLVTIAYHIFFIAFICWLLLPLRAEDAVWIALAAPPALLAMGLIVSELPTRYWPWFAAVIYTGSCAVFYQLGLEPLREIGWEGERPMPALYWLAPVLVFGFLLCPYLDLTFHRALQSSPSRHAFGIFGITFAVMILLTCAYWDVLETMLTWLVLSHIAAQSVFTVSAHVREVRQVTVGEAQRGLRYLLLLSPLLAMPLGFIGAFGIDPLALSVDMYIRFLVLYGLLFPAYVVLFLRPRGFALTRGNVIAYAIATIALMPLYELGFLHGMEWLLPIPPAVLIVWAAWGGARAGLLQPR